MKLQTITEANQQSLKATYSIKAHDPAMALVFFNATKIPVGEMPKADFMDRKSEIEEFLNNELKRVANRLTKRFA